MMSKRRTIKYRDVEGCWVCTSHIWKNKKGYLRIERDGLTTTMSRYMYTKYVGDIPKGKIIRHTCDNPTCINPSHLLVGTYQDNSQDCISRNRICKGESSPFSKLNRGNIRYILDSQKGARELGRLFKVAHTTIIRIRQNKKWKHIERIQR